MAEVRCISCKSAEEFLEELSPLNRKYRNCLFRGQADESWGLTPSFFREDNVFMQHRVDFTSQNPAYNTLLANEMRLIQYFVKSCDQCALPLPNDSVNFREILSMKRPFWTSLSENSYLWPIPALREVLALAQHFGMPTRLLDWTKLPYIAAYFAAAGSMQMPLNSKFAVWILDPQPASNYTHLKILEVPSGFNKNIGAQSGVFTTIYQRICETEIFGEVCLLKCHKEILEPLLWKITLPTKEATTVLRYCGDFGISTASLQPDYHGAAKSAVIQCMADSLLTAR